MKISVPQIIIFFYVLFLSTSFAYPQQANSPGVNTGFVVPASLLSAYPVSSEDMRRLREEPAFRWLKDAINKPDYATKVWSSPPWNKRFQEEDFSYSFSGAGKGSNMNILHLLAGWRWSSMRIKGVWCGFEKAEFLTAPPFPPVDLRRYAIAKALVEGADPNKKDIIGNTPMMVADEDAARVFIAAGVGNSDLLLAAAKCDFSDKLFTSILEKWGGDLSIFNGEGDSTLHLAVRNKSVSKVRMLLDAGADPNATNKKGNTPIVELTQPQYGPRSLYGDRSDLKGIPVDLVIAYLLVKAGADINAYSDSGRAFFHDSIVRYPEDTARAAFLLCLGANPILKGAGGISAQELHQQRIRKVRSVEALRTQRILSDWAQGNTDTAEQYLSQKMPLLLDLAKGKAVSFVSGTPVSATPATPSGGASAGKPFSLGELFPSGIMACGRPPRQASFEPLTRLRGKAILLYRSRPGVFDAVYERNKNDLILIFDPVGSGRSDKEISKRLRKLKVAGYTLPLSLDSAVHRVLKSETSDFVLLDSNLTPVYSGEYGCPEKPIWRGGRWVRPDTNFHAELERQIHKLLGK